jgi:hypothetical protein
LLSSFSHRHRLSPPTLLIAPGCQLSIPADFQEASDPEQTQRLFGQTSSFCRTDETHNPYPWHSVFGATEQRPRSSKSSRNLRGGIFRWYNEGKPVVDASGMTDDIHKFDPIWGMMVERRR